MSLLKVSSMVDETAGQIADVVSALPEWGGSRTSSSLLLRLSSLLRRFGRL